jgi:hypothetical protein
MKIFEIIQFTPTIQKLLKKHFDVDGTSTINNQGLVDVVGNVSWVSKLTELPVKFGHVSGDFSCGYTQLTSLTGAPHSVGGNFNCNANLLKSLDGAPQTVGSNFRCIANPLTSLTGAPTSIGGEFWCDYRPKLPLMRALVASSIDILNAPPGFTDVMNRHAGLGKRGMMKCASELLTLGKTLGLDFRANCRW